MNALAGQSQWQPAIWIPPLLLFFCQPPTSPSSPQKAPSLFCRSWTWKQSLPFTLHQLTPDISVVKKLFGSIDLRERLGGWEKRKINELYRDEGQVHMYARASPQQKASAGKESSATPNQLKIAHCRLRQQLPLRVNCLCCYFCGISALLVRCTVSPSLSRTHMLTDKTHFFTWGCSFHLQWLINLI